jgi:Phage integrase family
MSNSTKAMRVVRGISQSLCIVLLLLSCGALSAQNQEHRVRNIVLAHGAWADGSGWKGVYDILVKDGYNVSIVQEPETSFKEDVAATKRTLALQDGPCILVLAGHLRAWQRQTPFAKTTDFVFPSVKAEGRKPLYSSTFVADYLRPAAKKAGVHIEDGQRFGLHNLRHSLSNWLVNKAKVEPKTVQGILRHAKIQTTLDLYTQEDSDETRIAQGEFLTAVGMNQTIN